GPAGIDHRGVERAEDGRIGDIAPAQQRQQRQRRHRGNGAAQRRRQRDAIGSARKARADRPKLRPHATMIAVQSRAIETPRPFLRQKAAIPREARMSWWPASERPPPSRRLHSGKAHEERRCRQTKPSSPQSEARGDIHCLPETRPAPGGRAARRCPATQQERRPEWRACRLPPLRAIIRRGYSVALATRVAWCSFAPIPNPPWARQAANARISAAIVNALRISLPFKNFIPRPGNRVGAVVVPLASHGASSRG